MERIFTSDAPAVPGWLAAQAAVPSLVVSVMGTPPPAVIIAVAAHGAAHRVIPAEDDQHVCNVLEAAVDAACEAIMAHLQSSPTACVLIHCRKGKNRSTLLHFLLLWRVLRTTSAVQARAMVDAGRIGAFHGVAWQPKEGVVDYVRTLAWKRAHGAAPVVPMTWPFGATAAVQVSFTRYMNRVAAREAAAEAAALAAAARAEEEAQGVSQGSQGPEGPQGETPPDEYYAKHGYSATQKWEQARQEWLAM